MDAEQLLPAEMWALVLHHLQPWEEFPVALTCKAFYEALRRRRERERREGRVFPRPARWMTWCKIALASDAMLRWTREELGRPLTLQGHFDAEENHDQAPLALPHALVLHDGNLFVADTLNNAIRVLNAGTGAHVKLFPDGSDANNYTLLRPIGIAISTSRAEMFVTEGGKHRVSVLSLEGGFLRTFGKGGPDKAGDGELNYPKGVCLDKDDTQLFVCDTMNHRVQVFTLDGQFVRKWGKRGESPGQFRSPQDVKVSPAGGEVFVCDFNSRITVFTPLGEILRVLEQFPGTSPHGLAFSPSGRLHVCSLHTAELFELNAQDGALISKFSSRSLIRPKAIAVSSRGEVYVSEGDGPVGNTVQMLV